MNTTGMRAALVATLLYSLIAFAILTALPRPAHADGGMAAGLVIGGVGGLIAGQALGNLSGPNASLGGSFGMGADAQCIPAIPQCGCHQIMVKGQCVGGSNQYLCPCVDMTNGFKTTGFCQADNRCHATGVSGGIGGAGGSLAQQLTGLLSQIAQGLMQQGQGGGGSGSGSSPTTPTTGTGGCTQYYQVTQPSSDPCAYYVPPVSSTIGNTVGTTISDQLNSLNAALSTTTASNTNTSINTNLNSVLTQTTASATTTVAATSAPVIVPTGTSTIKPGVSGDIQVMGSGATVLAGSTDVSSNTTVAGFYGSDTFSGQPQGLVGQLCQNRPWASNFLSKIIPAGFFDGLCTLRGFQVGLPQPTAPAPVVTVTQSAPKPVSAPVAPTTSTVAPKATIWASPASVPLGSRTSVFWSSQGVTGCTETSPDGSFSQATLQGGGSTVPITGATTFTISCVAPDGTHVTDDVTVNLSI